MLSRFEQFSSVISGISRSIQKLERDEMVKYGGKGAFANYLVVLSRYPEGLTASKLCELCDKDKAAVSRIVCEMESKGLIKREGGNRYRSMIKLTEEGNRAAFFVRSKAKSAVEAVGSDLTDEQRKIFYETLELIALKLQTLKCDGIPEENDKVERDL
ncbi:MAG: winged helix-turn-helix transcriptional regulator [Oscillospiraceae bacterium]|nr:winged helix-turn-helix transcriptional regulator [Oscillospiraceae bacterium]